MSDQNDFGLNNPATDTSSAVLPAPVKPRLLPLYKVILHNADDPTFEFVIRSIIELTPLGREEAIERTQEADETGCSLLLVIHRERAELYEEQFRSKLLTVTIEPVE